MKKRKEILGLSLLCSFTAVAFAAPERKPWESFWVASGSMEKTLQLNDRILVSNEAYLNKDPKSNDVVTFHPPAEALLHAKTKSEDVVFVMRVVGVSGQSVVMRRGVLFVNGRQVVEKHALWDKGEAYDMKIVNGQVYSRDYSQANNSGASAVKVDPVVPLRWSRNQEFVEDKSQVFINKAAPGKIPAGQYLVLGDHRTNANDSHCWGFLPRSAIRGKAVNVFWPLSRRKPL